MAYDDRNNANAAGSYADGGANRVFDFPFVVNDLSLIHIQMCIRDSFRDEEKKNVRDNASKPAASSSNEEKSTLGDLDVLAELKKKMEGGN